MEDIKTFSNSNFNKSAYSSFRNSYAPSTVHLIKNTKKTKEQRNKRNIQKEMVFQQILPPRQIRP